MTPEDLYEVRLRYARPIIQSAPSYPALVKSAIANLKTVYGKDTIEENFQRFYRDTPESLLTAHAGVFNSKSARCKTLQSLADKVFLETGLPRCPQGQFRGQNGLDVNAIELPKD